ncbi:MAG TPA: hypothetical protein PLP19_18410 [bacterium]|nr:hypothetical protein [bacterium]HPN45471.1 hypothetical protein [bacterium]
MPALKANFQLEEVRRVMRKQLAAWCNPANLNPMEIQAVNQIIHSSQAARYPDVVVIVNNIDLGKALLGFTITNIQADRLFQASVYNTCYKLGIKLNVGNWPVNLSHLTIIKLSLEVFV